MKKCAALLVLAGVCVGADSPPRSPASKETAVREEMAKLQGTWQMIAATKDGEKVAESRAKKSVAEIKGDGLTLKYNGWTLASDVKFEIDPTQSPKALTELGKDPKDTAKQSRGIYSLEGDKLTICTAAAGKPRPSEFASKAGSGLGLRVFKKVAKK